jgi:hypothetical protein
MKSVTTGKHCNYINCRPLNSVFYHLNFLMKLLVNIKYCAPANLTQNKEPRNTAEETRSVSLRPEQACNFSRLALPLMSSLQFRQIVWISNNSSFLPRIGNVAHLKVSCPFQLSWRFYVQFPFPTLITSCNPDSLSTFYSWTATNISVNEIPIIASTKF